MRTFYLDFVSRDLQGYRLIGMPFLFFSDLSLFTPKGPALACTYGLLASSIRDENSQRGQLILEDSILM